MGPCEARRRGVAAVASFAHPRRERGAAIAEFAIVALVLWVLLAGMLELGRAYAAQQVLQNAASAAARDLSLREYPVDRDTLPSEAIFGEGFLVADVDLIASCLPPGVPAELTLSAVGVYLENAGAPILNRLLLPLWIRDVVDGQEVLRYPGAVLRRQAATGSCNDGSEYTVRIPEITDGDVEWRNVVEPLEELPFAFNGGQGGFAALRVLYPFQAVGFQGWTSSGSGQSMIRVTDPGGGPPAGTTFVSTEASGPYAGRYGLGVLYSFNQEVRPYRRVLAARAAFPREVFGPGVGS